MAEEPPDTSPEIPSRTVRSTTDRVFLGVCGGLAQQWKIPSRTVRKIYIIATICTAIIPGVVAYLLMAAITPKDDAPGSNTPQGKT